MTANETIAKLDESLAYIKQHYSKVPQLAIVAGSGLGVLAELVENPVKLNYGEVPHTLAPTVVGHSGSFVFGQLEGLEVVILSGRVHSYEGHALDEVVHNVRALARLGVPQFLITNAAGGIDPWMPPGSLSRIVDHINLTGQNVLTGPNIEAFGPRFPDMSHAYDPELSQVLLEASEAAQVGLFSGIYAGMSGPSYETPAEIRMLRAMGATLVGMSTVHETTALVHMGVKVAGLSCVTNYAAGVSTEPLNHDEVKVMAESATPKLVALIRAFAKHLTERSPHGG